MTERREAEQPRAEAARIACALRRHLERSRSDGSAELLARSARASASRAMEKARVGVSAPPAMARAIAEPVHSPAGAGALPPEVDLFGKPLAPTMPFPIPAVGREAEIARVSPISHHPIDPQTRRALAERSLPVLSQVAVEARACTRCGLCSTRTQAVPGVGSALSGIVFVGEAPGADEDRRGEPFVGRAGELLTRIIKAMDDARLIPGVRLSRDTVYICNVLKCRPPENRNPLPHEVESCSPYLRRQLEALQPRVICCLGKFAAELLVGVKGSIGALRGKVYRYGGAKLIVTYHPAFLLRSPAYKRPVWEDMQLLAREYQTE